MADLNALPKEVFEAIISNLNLAERCALESTCRAFRQLGLQTTPTPASAESTPLKGRLDNDEKIDSFGFWLYRRGSMLQHLKYEHLDCPRHNSIAFNAFTTISATLSSLHLVISKHAKNRRGIPGPATFTWMPVFRNLETLFLDFQWSVPENWELNRWAPKLKKLILRVPTAAQYDIFTDINRVVRHLGHPERNPLPTTLEAFKAFGPCDLVTNAFHFDWFKKLTSFSIQYPTKIDEKDALYVNPRDRGLSFGGLHDTRRLVELIRSTLTDLEFYYFNSAGPQLMLPQTFFMLRSLEKLKSLKWAVSCRAIIETLESSTHVNCLKSFSNIECLHILGTLPYWQDAALQGAFPILKELAIATLSTSREAYLPKGPCLLNLEHLIVDYSLIKTAIDLAKDPSAQLEERNRNKATSLCEFAPHMQNLKKVTVLTSGFQSAVYYDDIFVNIATWLRNLMSHTGYSIAVDIEGEAYLVALKNCFQSKGVVVGPADKEIAGSVEVFKTWEYHDQMEAIQNYDPINEYDE